MMYSKYTLLVLTDETEDQLHLGIRTVNAAQPVDQLVPLMKNELMIMVDNQLRDLEKWKYGMFKALYTQSY